MAAVTLPDPPLSDGVVTLRGFESSDVPRLVEINQDPEIPRWTLVPSAYTDQDARDWLTRVAARLGDGTYATVAIVGAADAELLGTCGLMAIDVGRGCAEIGYMLAAPARGQGFATRAVQLVVDWAFWTLGLEHLEIHVDKSNPASQAVAVRAGFVSVPEPMLRRPETAHFVDDVYFARVRGG